MMIQASRILALTTGIILPILETWRRWNMLSDWPSWLDDYIAGALLLYAWWSGWKEASASRPYLMAAWGYTFGIAYLSFFGQLKGTGMTDPSGVSREAVLAFKGFGLALAAACLAMAWLSDARELVTPADPTKEKNPSRRLSPNADRPHP